jgi:hypothetical protein
LKAVLLPLLQPPLLLRLPHLLLQPLLRRRRSNRCTGCAQAR